MNWSTARLSRWVRLLPIYTPLLRQFHTSAHLSLPLLFTSTHDISFSPSCHRRSLLALLKLKQNRNSADHRMNQQAQVHTLIISTHLFICLCIWANPTWTLKVLLPMALSFHQKIIAVHWRVFANSLLADNLLPSIDQHNKRTTIKKSNDSICALPTLRLA